MESMSHRQMHHDPKGSDRLCHTPLPDSVRIMPTTPTLHRSALHGSGPSITDMQCRPWLDVPEVSPSLPQATQARSVHERLEGGPRLHPTAPNHPFKEVRSVELVGATGGGHPHPDRYSPKHPHLKVVADGPSPLPMTDIGLPVPSMHPHLGLDEPIGELRTIGPLLRSLGVHTYRDLLGVSLDDLRSINGVGPRKIRMIEDLIQEAHRRSATEQIPPSGPSGSAVAPAKLRFDYDSWIPSVVLGRLPARIQRVILENDLRTIRALKEWHRRVDVRTERNFGRGSHTRLGELLHHLETEGHECLVFGGPIPGTVAEFAHRYLHHPETTDRELLELRLIQGWTLERIAQPRGVTRERIRQIIETDISDAQPSWGSRARTLIEPAMALLEQNGGIALTSRIRDALGNPPAWAIELTCLLAGTALSLDIIDGISTSLPTEEFGEIRREIRRSLGEAPQLSAGAVRGSVENAGLSVPSEDLPEVSDRMFGIRIEGEDAFPGRRSVQYLYLKALRDAGGPVSAEEVARRVNDLDPSVAATKHNAVVHFSRVSDVFNHSPNRWIHKDHLPIPAGSLADLVERCLPEIEKAGGRAVSTRLLLERLVKDGEAGSDLTPHILRDALIHTGKVRGWRAGSDVAWIEGSVHRKTIDDWIEEIADDLDQPFHISELIESVAQLSGNLRSSITVALHRPSKTLISLGHGNYVSKRLLWPDDAGFQAALAHVAAAVSASGLRSAEDDDLAVPGLEGEIARIGPSLVWGLAHLQPDIIGTRERGRLLWPAGREQTLWDVIARDFLAKHPLFRSQTLREFLRSRGLRSEHVVYILIKEGLQERHLERIGFRWMADSRVPSDQRLLLLQAQEELAEMRGTGDKPACPSLSREVLDGPESSHGRGAGD